MNLMHSVRIASVFCVCILAGCGGKPGVPKGTAAGKVTVNGVPVTEGTIIFENVEMGVSAMIPLKNDGSYVVQTFEGAGLPVGVYQVAVSPRKISNGEFPKMVQPSKEPPPPYPVPEKFRAVASSGWTAVIQEGTNPPFNFDAKK